MPVVIDTNILIAALLKDSTVRKLLLNLKSRILFPEIIFYELRNHENQKNQWVPHTKASEMITFLTVRQKPLVSEVCGLKV